MKGISLTKVEREGDGYRCTLRGAKGRPYTVVVSESQLMDRREFRQAVKRQTGHRFTVSDAEVWQGYAKYKLTAAKEEEKQ